MKKLLYFLFIFFILFFALIVTGEHIIKQKYLYNNGIILGSKIIKMETIRSFKGRLFQDNLRLVLLFIYENAEKTKSVSIKSLSNSHYIDERIEIYYDIKSGSIYPTKYIENDINISIVFFLFVLFTLIIYFYKITRKENIKFIKGIFGNRNVYILYIQTKDYEINEISKSIDGVYELIKQLDLKKLQKKEIICYGIKYNNSFIELYYNINNYSLKISNGNRVYWDEFIDSNDIEKYFHNKILLEFGNGA